MRTETRVLRELSICGIRRSLLQRGALYGWCKPKAVLSSAGPSCFGPPEFWSICKFESLQAAIDDLQNDLFVNHGIPKSVSAAQLEWNDVHDGMPPENNKCYLVYCASNRCQFTAQVDRWTGKWHLWTFGPSEMITNQTYITHWREMPSGPTE